MSRKKKGGIMPFLLGIAAALVLGWIIFPNVLYVQQSQPMKFNHKVHMEQVGYCGYCHSYRDDGSYAGLPTTDTCAMCHSSVEETNPPSINKLVRDYVQKDKEIPWKVYQKQPDNVYFSHIAHDDYDCTRCHPDIGQSSDEPPRFQNRLTGYTRTTMTMDECERCHAQQDASNACYVCHK